MIEHGKKSLLVIMDSYYPDSRATSYIMRRILEFLRDRYKIYVYCLELLNREDENNRPKEHNGIKIEYAKFANAKHLLELIYVKIKNSVVVMKYKRKFGTVYNYYKLSVFMKQIKKFIEANGIHNVISVASPADIHVCAEMLVTSCRGISWFPVSFDPHAYDYRYPKIMREKFEKEEKILYENAKRIFFLRQFENDYVNSNFKEKITYFDLLLFLSNNNNSVQVVNNCSENKIFTMVYTGSLYKDIRNPTYAFETLSSLSDIDFRLYIIGGFSGWTKELNAYLEKWKIKFGDKIVFLDRLSREEIARYFIQGDFFINIGNTTHNQCPSKVFDYIAYGKPIIHFKKIENCSCMQYLKNYPLVCVIDEKEDKSVSALRISDFIKKVQGRRVDLLTLQELYQECDVKYVADLFSKYI